MTLKCGRALIHLPPQQTAPLHEWMNERMNETWSRYVVVSRILSLIDWNDSEFITGSDRSAASALWLWRRVFLSLATGSLCTRTDTQTCTMLHRWRSGVGKQKRLESTRRGSGSAVEIKTTLFIRQSVTVTQLHQKKQECCVAAPTKTKFFQIFIV